MAVRSSSRSWKQQSSIVATLGHCEEARDEWSSDSSSADHSRYLFVLGKATDHAVVKKVTMLFEYKQVKYNKISM